MRYNPRLSVQENAARNQCSVATVRKYIRIHGIDRNYEGKVNKIEQIRAILKRNPEPSLASIARETQFSINTVKKYLPFATGQMKLSKVDTGWVSTFDINHVYCCDALDGLRNLGDCSIDVIITSPPYNKTGFNGKDKRTKTCIWNKNITYSGNIDNDCMDEELYEKWQVDLLNECFRVLKNDGSMFYNHKIRVKDNLISHPLEWISKSNFKCRQIITWDRTSSPNLDTCRYVPTTELIFWLTKTNKNPRFKRKKNAMFQSEVWRIPAVKDTKHPAPFPIELPDNIIPSVAQGERIVVLDPFMGSGTVAVSAVKHGCNYIGFDISQEYVDATNARLNKSEH